MTGMNRWLSGRDRVGLGRREGRGVTGREGWLSGRDAGWLGRW